MAVDIKFFVQERCLVFLDPDTGLEPVGGADAKHVLNDEAQSTWKGGWYARRVWW